jgi:hypothetical protein
MSGWVPCVIGLKYMNKLYEDLPLDGADLLEFMPENLLLH